MKDNNLELKENKKELEDALFLSKVPLDWPSHFFPFQIEGIKALLSMNAILLADDMGLGKTIQVIAAIRILLYSKKAEQALIIVPASLITQWRRQLRLWAPELKLSTLKGMPEERAYLWEAKANIFLIGYETFKSDFTNNPQSPPRRKYWDIVVLDEAQKIKNRNTEVSRKCKQIPRRRAWALTGTPLENTPDDLASILEFTQPFSEGQEMVKIWPGTLMRDIHTQLQLRRKKEEVLDELPPKVVSTVALSLTGQQRESYEKTERDGILQLRERGESIRVQNVLELILRLKQICNFCPRTGQSVKLENIFERLSTLVAEGHKAIIFSQFVDSKYGVNAIASRLRPFHPLIFSGVLDQHEKDVVIRQFKSSHENKVLILSLRSGGQGLNLQEASYVFHFDRWWNPAVEHQAEDRSHRLGQIYPVHVYQYICEDTIEERIEQILMRKERLFKDLVDEVTIDLKYHLTEEELFGLFGLIPPPKSKGKTS